MDVVITQAWRDFGLVGLMTGALSGLLFLIVKWTLNTTKEILAQAAREREIFQNLQLSWSKAVSEHSERANAFHSDVKVAHEYQRQEHEKMIALLDRIEERTKLCLKR